MGQKVNPHGLRVGVIKDWDSRWFAKDKDFGDTLVEDYNLRKHAEEAARMQPAFRRSKLSATLPRSASISTARSPVWSSARAALKSKSCACSAKSILNKPVAINIVEVKSPDLNAQLVAENIAQQLEKRISFRRAMKQCHRPRHEARRQGYQDPGRPAVWAALKSPEPSSTTRVLFRCRPSERTSITALPRLPPPTAASA